MSDAFKFAAVPICFLIGLVLFVFSLPPLQWAFRTWEIYWSIK